MVAARRMLLCLAVAVGLCGVGGVALPPPGTFNAAPNLGQWLWQQQVELNTSTLWVPYMYSAAQQYWPYWLGRTPSQMVAGVAQPASMSIPALLRDVFPSQLSSALQLMTASAGGGANVPPFAGTSSQTRPQGLWIECWPTEDPNTGRVTWSFARFALSSASVTSTPPSSQLDWQFFNVTFPAVGNTQNFNLPSVLTIVVPQMVNTWDDSNVSAIFQSFTQLTDLYADPLYANCVFAVEPNATYTGGGVHIAWPRAIETPSERQVQLDYYSNASVWPVGKRPVCYMIDQPAAYDNIPVSFQVYVGLTWSANAPTVAVDSARGLQFWVPAAGLPSAVTNGSSGSSFIVAPIRWVEPGDALPPSPFPVVVDAPSSPSSPSGSPNGGKEVSQTSFVASLLGVLVPWPTVPTPYVPGQPGAVNTTAAIDAFYFGAWKDDVQQFSAYQGRGFTFPISNVTKYGVMHKNAADPLSQLPIVAAWLTEKYRTFGVPPSNIWNQTFTYRGATHANVIVQFPGRNASLPPLVFMDHYDTAYDEDVFANTNDTVRTAAPGADDNGSAMATLLRAGALLAKLVGGQAPFGSSAVPLRRTVWLVHITGEEYPSDDLGCRHFLTAVLKGANLPPWATPGMPIAGVLLMDMIAWRRNETDLVFQINSGVDAASRLFAKYAVETVALLQSRGHLTVPLAAMFRSRYDPYSYLFNTDGDTIQNAGFPVLLFNEHINWYQNFGRPCYHQSCDTFDQLSLPYAASTVMVCIETLFQTSEHFDEQNVDYAGRTDAGSTLWPLWLWVVVCVAGLAAVLLVAAGTCGLRLRRKRSDVSGVLPADVFGEEALVGPG